MQQKVHLPKSQEKEKSKRPFRIGIIANETNAEDIEYYNEELKKINAECPEVSLVVFGYKPDSDRLNMLDSVVFEYIKPVSIIHYFKQMRSTEIDLLFIPLINNIYNATSENYNKYLEMALLMVPVITIDMYPYNTFIEDKRNGFIYSEPSKLASYIKELVTNDIPLIKQCGTAAHNDVIKRLNFSKENVDVLAQAFQFESEINR